MKLMHSYLCVRRHIESSFSNCMGPVKLMQASLGVRIDVEMIFHHCGGPAKLVHTTLSVQRNPRSSFHHRGGRAKLWQGTFREGKVPDIPSDPPFAGWARIFYDRPAYPLC